MSSVAKTAPAVEYRRATLDDGPMLWRLARDTGGLDLNSPYSYALMGWMFGESCRIAEDESGPLGFVVGLRPPERPEAVFVWQVGVLPRARGRGVALGLLDSLVDDANDVPTQMEATVTPGNDASRALFSAFARRRGATLEESPLMSEDLFPDEHEPEHLLTIAPI